MEKCAYPNKVLVFPHRESDGFTKGRTLKDGTVKDRKEKHRVVFNPDLDQLFGRGWILDSSVSYDAEYKKLIQPSTGNVAQLYEIGCGQCKICRQNHAFQWKLRLLMERQMYKRDDDCCFLTLDYNELFVPRLDNGVPTLDHHDVSVFLRNVRDAIQAKDPEARVRFFCAGEYGSSTERPHYHIILFGYDFFKGAQYVRKSRGGFALFHNPILDKAWSKDGVPKGGALFGMFSEGSAMYTAQYCVKKLVESSEAGKKRFRHILVHGEKGKDNEKDVHEFLVEDNDPRRPPYIQMSRNPGLGYSYIMSHKDEILADGGVYLCGQFFPISRYMMKLFINDGVPGIETIDFDRRRLLQERSERLDRVQQAENPVPLWRQRRENSDLALARSKVSAKMKGSVV